MNDEFRLRLWDELGPFAREIEETEHIDKDRVFPALSRLGLWGLLIPERYGGQGVPVKDYVPIIAELAKIHGGLRALVHVHNSMAHGLAEIGSASQCDGILPDAAVGTKSVAFALTEPEHGTGVDIGTTAARHDDGYAIDGQKHLITNSDFASHFIVFARVEECERNAGLSAFLVERNAPGLTIEPLPETMGCKGGQHGRLNFDGVFVESRNRLGEEGDGVEQMEEILELSRVLVAASSLGTAERALELATARSKERVTFGKPIASRQAVQRYLAEMAVDVYALRLMLDDCAERWDGGARIPAESALTKQFGLEAVARVTDRALLIFGGIGYTRTHEIERLYRDARLNWLEEGTPTIQYMVAARELVAGRWPEDRW